MLFTYGSHLLAFLANGHRAWVRLGTHRSCNQESVYPDNMWPRCPCMVGLGCLEHMRQEYTGESFYTYDVFPSGNMDNAKDMESEKYIFGFHTDCMFGLLCFPLHFWKKTHSWSRQHWINCILGFLKRHPEIQRLHWGGQRVEFPVIFLITQSQKIKPKIFILTKTHNFGTVVDKISKQFFFL